MRWEYEPSTNNLWGICLATDRGCAAVEFNSNFPTIQGSDPASMFTRIHTPGPNITV